MLGRRVVPLDFVIPQDRDAAVAAIQALHERPPGVLPQREKLLVQVATEHEKTRIYMHRDAGRNLHVEVRAELRSPQRAPRLVGHAQVSRFTWYFPFVIAALGIGMATLFGRASAAQGNGLMAYGFPILWVGFSLLLVVWIRRTSLAARDDLVRRLRQAVGLPGDGPS